MTAKRIRTKERDAILQSLKAGVTPKVGIQHIQVGRMNELKALIDDIDRIKDGGSAFRLIIGDFGAGKTFFLSVVRSVALEQKLVTINADLSPERRLYASKGQARNLYQELMRNIATRNKPDGNALVSIVEKFITDTRKQADQHNISTNEVIHDKLIHLTELVGGYDFAKVIEAYWVGHETHDEARQANAIKWLRAEYTTKTEAKHDLNVRSIISDDAFYDSLKLMSLFVRQAGYAGLLVNLDELVNLYKLNSTQARTANYEQILRILNDCLQGSAEHLGFLLGGTPEFLLDTHKGLYSYQALQSRLAGNQFATQAGVIDYTSPVLNLANLTPEELFILLKNLRHVHAAGIEENYLVPDEALSAFLNHCNKTIGDAYFRTPRNTIKAFLDMLSIVEQNTNITWQQLIDDIPVIKETPEIIQPPGTDNVTTHDDHSLSNFTL